MKSPKCPYCGDEQYLTIEDHSELGRMVYYLCNHCGSRSPAKTTIEEAYAAAMKRERAKGEWTRINYEPCGHDYRCSVCGWLNDSATPFCPNCGADMREAKDDE